MKPAGLGARRAGARQRRRRRRRSSWARAAPTSRRPKIAHPCAAARRGRTAAVSDTDDPAHRARRARRRRLPAAHDARGAGALARRQRARRHSDGGTRAPSRSRCARRLRLGRRRCSARRRAGLPGARPAPDRRARAARQAVFAGSASRTIRLELERWASPSAGPTATRPRGRRTTPTPPLLVRADCLFRSAPFREPEPRSHRRAACIEKPRPRACVSASPSRRATAARSSGGQRSSRRRARSLAIAGCSVLRFDDQGSGHQALMMGTWSRAAASPTQPGGASRASAAAERPRRRPSRPRR